MASRVIGISLDEDVAKRADRLARRRKLSRSGLVSSLLERELARERDGASVDVVVDGVRYVPAVNGAKS